FQAEEAVGLAMMRELSPEQQAKAIIGTLLPGEGLTAAYNDNVCMSYEGSRYEDLSSKQQGGLPPARHPLCLDWRVRRPRPLLLPHLQSSRAHRIRPSARHRVCERRTHARSYPHGRAHPERQRLRQGLAAPALRAARSFPAAERASPRQRVM